MIRLLFFFFLTLQLRAYPPLFEDQKQFYSKESLTLLSVSLISGGILAHLPLDQQIFDFYQEKIRSLDTDKFSALAKSFGNKRPLLSSLAIISLTGFVLDQLEVKTPFFDFGNKALCSILVGVSPLIIGQNLLGAHRPKDHKGSHWRPFENDRAISGHAFMGAIPFITAAHLTSNLPLKIAFFLASTFTGISRINDSMHYPSQVFLGWMLAYASCKAVEKTHVHLYISPYSLTLSHRL
jgi:hypothetical protein